MRPVLRGTVAIAFAAFFPMHAAAGGICESELAAQATAAGLPVSLASALSSSLAIGHGGRMHPNAVSSGRRSSEEPTAEAAAKLAYRLASAGAADVRVGCLGVSVPPGSDLRTIEALLRPQVNIGQALGGIRSLMEPTDIGKPLGEIASDKFQTERPVSPPPIPDIRRSPGFRKENASSGAIGSTWGLFNDRSPEPLSNP